MAKVIKCKDCQKLENRKIKKETNRGSGVYAVIGTHYYCPLKKEIMTGQEVLKKGCAAGVPIE